MRLWVTTRLAMSLIVSICPKAGVTGTLARWHPDPGQAAVGKFRP